MKASTRCSLCASTLEEGCMGRCYILGAIKLKVDNTVMVTTGEDAGFFSQQKFPTKITLKPLNVALWDVAVSEEL